MLAKVGFDLCQKNFQGSMSKVRVVDVTNFINSKEVSGVEKIFFDFCEDARLKQIPLEFVSFYKGKFYQISANALPLKNLDHFPLTHFLEPITKFVLKRFYYSFPNFLRSYFGYLRILVNSYLPLKSKNQLIDSPYTFHECDLYLFDFIRDPRHLRGLRKILKSEPVRLHAFVHDVYPIKKDVSSVPEWRIPFGKFLKLVSSGYRCFVPSFSTLDELLQYFNKNNRMVCQIQVFRYPIPKFYPETDSCLPNFNMSNFVLYVSSFLPRKNHSFLIKGIERLNIELHYNLSIVLVGSGEYNSYKFQTLLRKRVKSKSVSIYRKLPECCLAKLYRLCDFTVYPSLHEGFGLPVLESISFNKLALVSNLGATSEFVNFEGVILFDPRSYVSFKQGILQVLHHEGKINQKAIIERLDEWKDILSS
jgi:glycosyltransferase involved in cell wall biosynthesis